MQKVQNTANIATAAASKMGARVRMTEGNACFRGGKPGVSDVLLRSGQPTIHCCRPVTIIWASICTGVTVKSVANSVGGSLPGDALLEANGETPEQIAAHPHPYLYTDYDVWLGLSV